LYLGIEQHSGRIGMDEPPLPFRIHGIRIGLAEETHAIRLQQFLDTAGEALKLATEQGDSASILHAAEDEFLLPLALGFLIDAR
jgi:hypothetical protein